MNTTSMVFLLCGILCGLVLIRVVRNVKNRVQFILIAVAFLAALTLALAAAGT